MKQTIDVSVTDVEKIVAFLGGFSAILRDSLPQRLFDTLDARKDDPHIVFEALRYDLPTGPVYVAEEVEAVVGRLRESLDMDGGGEHG